MWVLKPTVSLRERKIWFAHAQESKHDLKCESNPLPFNCEPLSKIGRLLKWKLFQEPESTVHWSDGYFLREKPWGRGWAISCQELISIWYAPDHADWFVAVHLLIFHILMIPNKDAPGWFGTGQAVGWCTSQPRPQGVLIAVNGVVPSK